MTEEQQMEVYLHKNIIINSEKQKSAQGSVFYVKMADDDQKEVVLKIYKNEDIKSYFKEIAVFRKLMEIKTNPDLMQEGYVGFPEMISNLEGNQSAEILMEALGPNLRKLLK
jgi:hypothetical protein